MKKQKLKKDLSNLSVDERIIMKTRTTEVEPSWYTAFVFLMGMLFMGLIVWLVMWLA